MRKNTFSYWEQTAFLDKADVIIIGSGIVGLNAAIHLKKLDASLNILVLERGFLPTGASTKNAGFACFGTISEQIAAIEHASEDEMVRMVDYKWRGLQRLRQNLGDANIDYRQHGGYELFFNDETGRAELCIENIDYLNKLLHHATGSPAIYSVANDKIAAFGFKQVGWMIFNEFEGQIHTGKMMRALLYKAHELGILVLNGCTIERLENGYGNIRLITSQGNFKTGKVILATNAFASQLYPELKVVPGRGQVLVTRAINGLKLKGTYHFDEGYYYFRNINGRVLFGGGRNLDFEAERTWESGHTEKVQQRLIAYLTDVILPGQPFEIDSWWSGIMGFGEDISPIVKQLEPGLFCAVCCNGMGVAMGSLVGEEVAELVMRG